MKIDVGRENVFNDVFQLRKIFQYFIDSGNFS